MIDQDLLTVLICPTDRTPLTMAPERLVAQVNRAIAAGQVKNQEGKTLTQPIDGGLLHRDATLLYPIQDGIPVLLANEAIPLIQIRQ